MFVSSITSNWRTSVYDFTVKSFVLEAGAELKVSTNAEVISEWFTNFNGTLLIYSIVLVGEVALSGTFIHCYEKLENNNNNNKTQVVCQSTTKYKKFGQIPQLLELKWKAPMLIRVVHSSRGSPLMSIALICIEFDATEFDATEMRRLNWALIQ